VDKVSWTRFREVSWTDGGFVDEVSWTTRFRGQGFVDKGFVDKGFVDRRKVSWTRFRGQTGLAL